jgi:transcriptional regulator with XRE-family HTH domain
VEGLLLPVQVAEGDFGGWVRDAMARRGISQRVLAMRTGVSHSTISRLVTGDRTPSLSTALAIIRVLAGPPDGTQRDRIG